MSRDLHLHEGEKAGDVELTRAEAAALNGTRLVKAVPHGDRWTVTAEYRVGAVRCGDLDVRIIPKVGSVQVLRLLARANGVHKLILGPDLTGLSDDSDLSAVLAVFFEHEARTALTQGAGRGYRAQDQSLPVVQGRIRLRDQDRRRFGQVTPIEVTVDEWTLDTDENRRLLAATHALLGLPGVPTATRRGLQRIERVLAGVTRPPPGTAIPPWTPTRLNAHLYRLLALADLALGDASVEHRAGGVAAHGFVINMAWLFQTLIGQLLDEQCRRRGLGQLRTQHVMPLDDDGRLTIKPDLVVSAGDGHLAVADVKYKMLGEKGTLPNADAYQLLAYCTRLGLSAGHLIYAHDPQDDHAPYELTAAGKRLVVHNVDLRNDLPGIEASVENLLSRMLPDRTVLLPNESVRSPDHGAAKAPIAISTLTLPKHELSGQTNTRISDDF
jgi:5-methylcytosine-specific restriction enzyme subunit McrC